MKSKTVKASHLKMKIFSWWLSFFTLTVMEKKKKERKRKWVRQERVGGCYKKRERKWRHTDEYRSDTP